jgi:hypothetical protein
LDQVRQRLLNPGAARTLVPAVPSPADAKPQAMGEAPDTVAADHPPASSSRPRTATLAGRFATHFRRFRLAISVSFTVSLAVAVYFVNLPRYADIDASRVPIPPPMTDSQPAPQSLPSEQPIQSPRPEAVAKKQITRDDQAGKRGKAASPPPAGRLLRRPAQEGAAEQQQEPQRQEVPSAAVVRPAPAPPGLEAQRLEAQRQEAKEQEAQWLAARKQAEQRQKAQRLAAVERERQSQAELIAISEAKKQADGAKVQMLTEKQRVSTFAPGYAEAQNEERQANALYERSSFNEAAEKYRSAAMLYARAKPAASQPRPLRPLPPQSD